MIKGNLGKRFNQDQGLSRVQLRITIAPNSLGFSIREKFRNQKAIARGKQLFRFFIGDNKQVLILLAPEICITIDIVKINYGF